MIPPAYTLPPDKLVKALALARAGNWAYFGGTAWTVFALWALVRLKLGAAIRALAARANRREWVRGLIAAPFWLLVLTLIGLPFSLWMQHVQLRYGISVEAWTLWWADVGKSTALTLIFGTILLAIVYALMRHAPRRWWLWTWIVVMIFEVAAVFVVPIVIDPLFNHFSPLEKADPALVVKLEQVAARGGMKIPPSRMYVMNASTRTTGSNAYVTGFGASKRIVVWNTTLKQMSPDEILAIYGHEQGHYVLHHIAKGMVFSAVVMFVFFWIAFRLFRWISCLFSRHWRVVSLSDWSSLGLLLTLITVLGFFADPIGNAFSRHIEHRADVYGETIIQGLVPSPQATMAETFQNLGEEWLEVPHPNKFIVFWTFSHPPITDRMKFAATFHPKPLDRR